MPSVLPPTQAEKEDERQEATPAHGCDPASDLHSGIHEAAGFTHTGTDVLRVDNEWEQLLAQLRTPPDPIASRSSPQLVGAQFENRVLLPQVNRSAHTALWVVNAGDWVDVEFVLRKLMSCESTECHAFHSIGYVLFRSNAVNHVLCPGDHLQSGTVHKFPDTEVVVEIARAHPEGVLEVECYLEYDPTRTTYDRSKRIFHESP